MTTKSQQEESIYECVVNAKRSRTQWVICKSAGVPERLWLLAELTRVHCCSWVVGYERVGPGTALRQAGSGGHREHLKLSACVCTGSS